MPVAPGEQIREILEERGIAQTDFAIRLGKSEKFVSQLINGKAPLSYDTAIELERVLGVPRRSGTTLSPSTATFSSRIRNEQEAAEQGAWAQSFPLKAMESKRWIARETGPAQQAEQLLSFFGVSSIEAYENYWGAQKRLAARMSTAYTAETPALAAWLRAGERAAEQIQTEPYKESAFRQALGELRGASRLEPSEWCELVEARCTAAGVAVVFVPDLPRPAATP